MYYIYLKHQSDSLNPDKIVVLYEGNYYERQKRTDWSRMDERDRTTLENGSDEHYFSVEQEQFDAIIKRWGGSRYGYRNQEIDGELDNEGYGDSYDELD
jgi:hypothetical protein